MAYGDFKGLNGRTVADKDLLDKTFSFAKNPKYDRYQRGLTSIVQKFLIENIFVEQLEMKLCLIKN